MQTFSHIITEEEPAANTVIENHIPDDSRITIENENTECEFIIDIEIPDISFISGKREISYRQWACYLMPFSSK